ncbi:hypothetical protein M2421_004257 [Stenotrophomonas sp. BIGb0135]|nr:hypothetical protein [Stenotrophomonas sp. BIGb0135]
MADALRALPELVDVESKGDEGMRQVVLDIDRDAAARLGVDMRMIASVLNNAFSQRQVATLYDTLNQYRVVMELDPRYTQDPSTLDQIHVIGKDGQPAAVVDRQLVLRHGAGPHLPQPAVRLGLDRVRPRTRRDPGPSGESRGPRDGRDHAGPPMCRPG